MEQAMAEVKMIVEGVYSAKAAKEREQQHAGRMEEKQQHAHLNRKLLSKEIA